jgi:nucleoside-diphosphate-sugar epimerase
MPTAFVTGGSGFIGGALIERLRREGWEVRALARSERAAERVRELGAEPVMGDLDDLHVEGCEIAFHAAAKVEDFGDPPLTRFQVWVSSQECTIDISRAGRELDYRPVKSREDGLAELAVPAG